MKLRLPNKLQDTFIKFCEEQGHDPQEHLETLVKKELNIVRKIKLKVFIDLHSVLDVMKKPPFWSGTKPTTDRERMQKLAEMRTDLHGLDPEDFAWKTLYNRIIELELTLGLTPTVLPGVPVPKSVLEMRSNNNLCIRCGNPRLETPKYCKVCVERIRHGDA